ncbi:MAG: hypothetical protein HYZ17_02825 [Betaproteobacteria bacterium]|nr:hypothetical protein [Betaproteobacteria bacterium]
MFRHHLLALTFLLCGLLAFALPARAALELIDTVVLPERLGRTLDQNVLKLHGLAIDPTRNLVYSAGIMSSALGVLDGTNETWTRTYQTGAEGFALKYLEVDAVANRLYVNDATNHTLRAIDLASGTVRGPVTIDGTIATPVADTRRGLVYLTQPSSPTFRAYHGADLSLAYSTDAMGAGAAHAIYDAGSDRVYVLDAATSGQLRIYSFDPAARAVASTLTLALGPNQRPYRMAYDATNHRFFVVVGAQVLAVSSAGTLLGQMALSPAQTTKDLAYDPDRNELAVLVIDKPADGTQADSGGHVLFFSGQNYLPAKDLAFAKKPSSLLYNPSTRRFYTPESDASTVWSIAGGGGEVHGLRLGDSAEMITLARAGESVYLTSRLGGSYLLEWKASTSGLETFTAGFWPIPTRSNDAGNAFYVLNAWDSTLSVFDLTGSRQLVATIPLGLVRGTTDRLPDLGIDSTRQRAYAAYPEFGKIAVVDLANRVALAPISVPGFQTGDTGGGPGQLQVRVVPGSGRLFAFWQTVKHLTVWDVSGSTPTLLLDRQLSGMPSIGASLDQLFVDATRNRVYAGPMELDGSTGLPTGRMLARGERVIGLDQTAGVLFASGVETVNGVASDVVSRLDRASLAVVEAVVLGPVPSAMNTQYAYDAARQRLYAADGQADILRVYNATGTTLAARVTAVEFHHASLNHYFLTADRDEARAIDRGGAGAGWARTGSAFYAYPASGAPASASPVCRFYGTPGIGPNSHFYTADAGECSNAKTDPGWTYEGIAFATGLPASGGHCNADQVPIYRAYNGRWQQNDSNHRYSADPGIYASTVGAGWAGEGVVFCAPR